MQFAKTRIRCPIYPSKVGENFFNLFSNTTPKIYKGAGVDFELALFDSPGNLFDIGNVVDFTLMVKPVNTPGGAAEILKTVAPAGNISQANWEAGTAQHVSISLLGSETAIAAGTHDLTIWGHTSDAGSDPDVFGTTKIEVLDAGITAVTNPTVTPTYLTEDQIRQLIAGFVRFNGNPAGSKIQLPSDNGQRYILIGCDDNGNPTFGTQPTD